jgi:hypothetical protein
MKKVAVVHGLGVRGIRGLNRGDWVALAKGAVHDLVNTRLAVPHVELEARLWESVWEEPATGRLAHFFPHILSEAVRDLTVAGLIVARQHHTKGATGVDLLTPTDMHKRQTAINEAVRRKGMLYGRFLRWSKTEFGPAGEQIVRASLTDQMHRGYTPMESGFGEVTTVGRTRIRGVRSTAAHGCWPRTPRPGFPPPTPCCSRSRTGG